MMEVNRQERLRAKYGAAVDKKPGGLNVMGRPGPGRMMAGGGKPKSVVKTLGRLLGYLSRERGMLIVALVCALLHTVAALASTRNS